MKTALSALSIIAALGLALPATAGSFKAGTITLGFGLANVNPQSDNGTVVAAGKLDIGSATRPTITAEYFIRDNLGIELLGALPFKHSIDSSGVGHVGSTMQLPPVVSIQYHFPTEGAITPFLGAGLNYTWFFNEKSALGSLKLGNSFGLALHAGADFQIGPKSYLRADVRWANIESKVSLNGTYLGKAKVNPTVLGLSYVMQF